MGIHISTKPYFLHSTNKFIIPAVFSLRKPLGGMFLDEVKFNRIVMFKNGEVFVQGECAEVMNSGNILCVYDVESLVRVENGLPIVMPLDVHYSSNIQMPVVAKIIV